jgi:hypothetical protein
MTASRPRRIANIVGKAFEEWSGVRLRQVGRLGHANPTELPPIRPRGKFINGKWEDS